MMRLSVRSIALAFVDRARWKLRGLVQLPRRLILFPTLFLLFILGFLLRPQTPLSVAFFLGAVRCELALALGAERLRWPCGSISPWLSARSALPKLLTSSSSCLMSWPPALIAARPRCFLALALSRCHRR